MRTLILGGTGMLGRAVLAAARARGWPALALSRRQADVADEARLDSAFVGPYTSIGERCTLVCCEIENSIVLADSTIRDIPLRIDGSLIGRNVRIVKTDQKPKAYRFMVGDNSEVGIT